MNLKSATETISLIPDVHSDDLDVRCYCEDCGKKLEILVSYKGDSLQIDIAKCSKCSDQIEDSYEQKISRLEQQLFGADEAIQELEETLEKATEEYKDQLDKVNLLLEALSL